MDAPELLAIIKQLYNLNITNKGALASIFDPVSGNELLREKTEHEIDKAFFPKRGLPTFKIGAAQKALREYLKIVSLQEGIEMMLYYVEQGIHGTNEYGEIHDEFYISLETVFEQALKNILQIPNPRSYLKQLHKLLDQSHGIGTGFPDQIGFLLKDFEDEIS